MSTLARSFGLVALALATSCTPSEPSAVPAVTAPPASAKPPASLDLDRAELARGGATPALIGKLEASRFRYFRMLAEPFEHRVCAAFGARGTALPTVAIHGDPHVEQFVVTAETYGLEDFDRSGFGPAVIDEVRFAASIHLFCKEAAFRCDADAAIGRFLSSWRATLERPPAEREPPAVVARLRSRAPSNRAEWLAWADKLTVPLPPHEAEVAKVEWAKFGSAMQRIHPDRPNQGLDVVSIGSLAMGFGSALERKALIRVAGPTSSPDDDLLIEARQGMPPTAGGCVWRPTYGESLVLMFNALLGRRLPDVHGFVPLFGAHRFWVQSWDPGYQEIALADITSQAELEELVDDAATQLIGHLWTHYPERLRPYQLYAQLETFDATRTDVVTLARQLADETDEAWQRFRGQR